MLQIVCWWYHVAFPPSSDRMIYSICYWTAVAIRTGSRTCIQETCMERGHWSGMSCSLSAPIPHPMMLAIYLYSRASLFWCVINIFFTFMVLLYRAAR